MSKIICCHMKIILSLFCLFNMTKGFFFGKEKTSKIQNHFFPVLCDLNGVNLAVGYKLLTGIKMLIYSLIRN